MLTSESQSSPTGFTHLQLSSSFIQKIREETRNGYSISPFVGSGISAASGILMGREFTDYLAHTVTRVLKDGWDIRRNGWPEQPTRTTHDANVKYLEGIFDHVCRAVQLNPRRDVNGQLYGFEDLDTNTFIQDQAPGTSRLIVPKIFAPSKSIQRLDRQRIATAQLNGTLESLLEPTSRPNLSNTSQEYVRESGIRHLFDWRATLKFLATVTIRPDRQATMGDFDSSVIDSFNRHITSGRKPNLGHKMLAHLSRPLRSRIFLTTNFDDLLEQALGALDFSVETLDVRTGVTLPPPFTVRAQNTVLKLHGSLIETRADFTLDSPPNTADKRHLEHMVIGNGETRHILSHLLVIGYSGYDRRCVLMIKHLLDSDERFKVFWVCFSESDVDYLQTLFHESEYKDRLIVIQTSRPDLLLYEMYQELTFSLPSGGFAYEFTHKVPPRPLFDPDDNHRFQTTSAQESLATQIADVVAEGGPRGRRDKPLEEGTIKRGGVYPAPDRKYRLVMHNPKSHPSPSDSEGGSGSETDFWFDGKTRVYLFEIESGSLTTARLVFDALETKHGRRCLWMEMQDYVDSRHMCNDLFRTLAMWRGVHQIEHLRYVQNIEPTKYADNVKEWARRECKNTYFHYANLLEYLQFADRGADGKLSTNLVVFLYGRNVPGACAGHRDLVWSHDQPIAPKDRAPNAHDQLHVLLEVLSRCGITVVYMPFTKTRYESEKLKKDRVPRLREELKGQLLGLGMIDQQDKQTPSRGNYGAEVDKELYKELQKEFSQSGLGSKIAELAIDKHCEEMAVLSKSPDTSAFYTTINSLLNNFLATRVDQASPQVAVETDKSSELDTPGNNAAPERYALLDEDGPDDRLKFLYAVTLFRQSRHVSAFLSEAVFRCPHRFLSTDTPPWKGERKGENAGDCQLRRESYQEPSSIPLEDLGPDNDLARKAVTDLWIRILRKNEIFLFKAGAYCWKFRDIRLALREILELESLPLKRSRFPRAGRELVEEGQLDFIGQMRPRTHLWIGSWYVHAFLATGHTNPLVEAIYHYLQAIVYSFIANSSNNSLDARKANSSVSAKASARESQRDYSEAIRATACFDLRKLLRLSVGMMPVYGWGPSNAVEGSAARKEAVTKLASKLKSILVRNGAGHLGEVKEVDLYGLLEDVEAAITFSRAQAEGHERRVNFSVAATTVVLDKLDNDSRMSRICGTKSVSLSIASADAFHRITRNISAATGSLFWAMYLRSREPAIHLPQVPPGITGDLPAIDALRELVDDRAGQRRAKDVDAEIAKKITERLEQLEESQRNQIDEEAIGDLKNRVGEIHHEFANMDNGLSKYFKPKKRNPWRFGDVLEDILAPLYGKKNESLEDSESSCSTLNTRFNNYQPALRRWCLSTEHAKAVAVCGESSPLGIVYATALAEAAYAFLKRGKMEIFSLHDHHGSRFDGSEAVSDAGIDEKDPEGYWSLPGPKSHLISATVACNLAIRCCQLIPPEHLGFEIDLRVRVQALYATALGYLGRYYEAHRRLNEAMALLSKSPEGLKGLPLAIVRLRRAEIYLAHAKKIYRRLGRTLYDIERADKKRFSKGSGDRPHAEVTQNVRKELGQVARQFYATLDDAVVHLEYAEKTLSGVATSNVWWGRYIILMLRSYSVLPSNEVIERLARYEVHIDPLLYRRRQQHDATIRTLFRRLVNTTIGDDYRSLRAVDMFVRALLSRLGDGIHLNPTDPTIESAQRICERLWSEFKLQHKMEDLRWVREYCKSNKTEDGQSEISDSAEKRSPFEDDSEPKFECKIDSQWVAGDLAQPPSGKYPKDKLLPLYLWKTVVRLKRLCFLLEEAADRSP